MIALTKPQIFLFVTIIFHRLFFSSVTLTLASLVTLTFGQTTGQSQCQLRFRTSATSCMTNATLNIANVQYIASNGTSGTPPTEGVAVYRQRICK